jgi:hypothetical protein
MLIHQEIDYCLTGQLITPNIWSLHSQMIEKAGQIGLTALVIKFRFATRSHENLVAGGNHKQPTSLPEKEQIR